MNVFDFFQYGTQIYSLSLAHVLKRYIKGSMLNFMYVTNSI